jgi:NitT/TauT family transport system substrate-binding protein
MNDTRTPKTGRLFSRLRRLTAVAAALLLTLPVAACSSSDGDTPATKTLTQVTYLTGAGVLGREAYVDVAIDKGYFRDAGLDVKVESGNGTEQNLKLLQAGKADYAVVDITAALIAYGKKTFTGFQILSAIQQRNLSCIVALSGSGISGPTDLAGKRIAYIPGGVVYLLFNTYASLAHLDPAAIKSIKWVSMNPQQMPQNLAAGSVDAVTQFVVGKPGIEAAAGKGRTAVILPFSTYMQDLYGNGLAASKTTLADKPDQVRAFNAAMLRGLDYAMDHPEEAGQIYAKYQPHSQPATVAAAENTLMAPYVKTAGKVGVLDQSRVARNVAILQGAGLIPAGLTPTDVIASDFALAG